MSATGTRMHRVPAYSRSIRTGPLYRTIPNHVHQTHLQTSHLITNQLLRPKLNYHLPCIADPQPTPSRGSKIAHIPTNPLIFHFPQLRNAGNPYPSRIMSYSSRPSMSTAPRFLVYRPKSFQAAHEMGPGHFFIYLPQSLKHQPCSLSPSSFSRNPTRVPQSR
ncbi:hypothetical protein IQ06DRAFT_61991 [Phaeosphaeriaceae sp. SRC1lsM3a]|nr:hypothetical protein IQ06DRAFT_61991 [Stagonospora sp. SRC1lsM3a]